MAEGRGVIEHIEIENFKSLHKVSLDLGPLNIFLGTNASGKTNFLEALRVLQGIGYGYTVDEIFNEGPGSVTPRRGRAFAAAAGTPSTSPAPQYRFPSQGDIRS
jgi:predicted ATPase